MPHHVASRPPAATLLALRLLALALGGVLLLVGPAPAQQERPPLPADEQVKVNLAIDRGAAYLLATQNAVGTWGTATKPGRHNGFMVGHTALPALTLLECGVAPDHPAIKKAAAVIRASWVEMDATYELALSILFLDRLGNPKDKALIETFAARLIAGQTPSGGWSYSCPPISGATQKQLLTVLRQLNPTSGLTLLPGELTQIKGSDMDPNKLGRLRPADPGPVERGRAKPGGEGRNDLARVRAGDKPPADLGLVKDGPRSPGETSPTRTGEKPPGGSLWEPNYRSDDAGGAGRLAPRPGQCIKVAEGPAPDADPAKGEGRPGGDKGGPKDGGKGNDPKPGDVPKPPPVKVVIPPALAGVPVLRDPNLLAGWVDPPKKEDVPTVGTTDNSNTQFAILALWVSQRHGVPMERTLDLVVRRYRASQNADGGWGYHYAAGGGEGGSPAMTGVGLLGLAVGHGLARDGRPADGAKVQDPRVRNGFVALTRHVGDPVGRTVNVPMNNLYFLWSIERVAVLYNLRTIGKKDWYRWGAEILVANQGVNGEWDKGDYPGAKPVTDTCFALLFLRRANLASDLTARLPFDPEQLSTDIATGQTPAEPTPAPGVPPGGVGPGQIPTPPVPPDPLAGLTQPPDPGQTGGPPVTSPTLSRTGTGDGSDSSGEGSGGGSRRWLLVILLGLGVLLLLGGGAAFWFTRGGEDKESGKKRKGKGKKRRSPREEG